MLKGGNEKSGGFARSCRIFCVAIALGLLVLYGLWVNGPFTRPKPDAATDKAAVGQAAAGTCPTVNAKLPTHAPALPPSPFAFDYSAFERDAGPISVGRISATACPTYLVSVPSAAQMPWLQVTAAGTLSGGADPHGYIAQYTPFVAHLKPTDVVLDVGANLGLSVLPMASHGVQVVGFEPVTRNVLKLRQSVMLNRMVNVAIVHGAVGNPTEAGQTVKIYAPADREDNTSLNPDVANANVNGQLASEDVELIGIDQWLHANAAYVSAASVKFMKVDVQGFEYGVVQGARQLLTAQLRKGLVVQCEFAPAMIAKGGGRPIDLLQYMHELGYTVHTTHTRDGAVLPPTEFAAVAGDQAFVDDLVFAYVPGGPGGTAKTVATADASSPEVTVEAIPADAAAHHAAHVAAGGTSHAAAEDPIDQAVDDADAAASPDAQET